MKLQATNKRNHKINEVSRSQHHTSLLVVGPRQMPLECYNLGGGYRAQALEARLCVQELALSTYLMWQEASFDIYKMGARVSHKPKSKHIKQKEILYTKVVRLRLG